MDLSDIFGKKKKKSAFPNLEALKTISFITGSALALNKALKAKIHEQQKVLFKKQYEQEKKEEEFVMLIAGFVGGLVAGAITALLVAPQPGDEFRQRIIGMFGNGHDEETAIKEASQKAEELAETAKLKAERAERNISDN